VTINYYRNKRIKEANGVVQDYLAGMKLIIFVSDQDRMNLELTDVLDIQ